LEWVITVDVERIVREKRFDEINEDIVGSGCEKRVVGSVLRDRMMEISSLHQ
jgi:hypothetical protein